jgi:hypothetical protein
MSRVGVSSPPAPAYTGLRHGMDARCLRIRVEVDQVAYNKREIR